MIDTLIKNIKQAPWTYVSLREQVDQGALTLEQAREVLLIWKETIEAQEATDRAADPGSVERILQEEKPSRAEGEAYPYTYPEQYRVKAINEQFSLLREALGLFEEIENPDQDNLEDNFRYRTLAADCQQAIAEATVDGIFWIPPIYLTARAARKFHPKETKGKADDEVALWYVLEKLHSKREQTYLPPLYDGLANDLKKQRLHPRAALAHATNELDSNSGLTFWPLQTGQARSGETTRRTLLDLMHIPRTPL